MNPSYLEIVAKIGAWVLLTCLVIINQAQAVPCGGSGNVYPDAPSAAAQCEVLRANSFTAGETTDSSCSFHAAGFCDAPSTKPVFCYYIDTTSNGGSAFEFCTNYPADTCVPPQVPNPANGLCEDPPEDDCSSTAGSINQGLIGGSPTSAICVSGCRYDLNTTLGGMTVTNTGAFTNATSVQYIGSGESCGGGEGTNNPPTNNDVTDTDNDGIPEVDGQELPEVPPPSDECVVLPNGALYCGSNAPSPPTPDNGTPGQPASPDQTVTNNTTNTTNNYYDDTTTSSGSTGTPTGQDPGVCDPSVENCGTDQETGVDNGCGQLPTCTGDAIDCLHAKLQHDTRCSLQTDIEDVTESDVMGQIGVDQTVEEVFTVAPEDEIDVNSEFFNITAGAGSCPAPLSITIPYVGPTNIPFTEVCNVLSLMRPAVILFSNIIAGLMLFRAFRDGL